MTKFFAFIAGWMLIVPIGGFIFLAAHGSLGSKEVFPMVATASVAYGLGALWSYVIAWRES